MMEMDIKGEQDYFWQEDMLRIQPTVASNCQSNLSQLISFISFYESGSSAKLVLRIIQVDNVITYATTCQTLVCGNKLFMNGDCFE